MGFDDLVSKAKDLVEENPDKVSAGLDKAAGLAKQQFGHGDQVDQAVNFVEDKLGLDDKQA